MLRRLGRLNGKPVRSKAVDVDWRVDSSKGLGSQWWLIMLKAEARTIFKGYYLLLVP